MKNPDEAIEQYQLAKLDRERLERMRHIGCHMPGLLTCDDGTRWHPTEILALVDEVKRLRGVVEFQKAAWAGDLAERDALQADNVRLREALGRCRIILQHGKMKKDVLAQQCVEEAKTLLAATPAQSLARLRNQAIEKCAVELDGHWDMAAGIIRAMKVPE